MPVKHPANVLDAMLAFLEHHYADALDDVAKECLGHMHAAVDALRAA